MDGGSIGIKLADRSYFPIVEEDNPGRRRVELTAARDHQDRVDVTLYRELSTPAGTHQRIGELYLTGLPDRASDDNRFALLLNLDRDGQLDARITDIETGNANDLAVDINNLPLDFAPDDLDDHSAPLVAEAPRRRRTWLVVPAIIVVLGLIWFALWYMFLRAEPPVEDVTDQAAPVEAPTDTESAETDAAETVAPEVAEEPEPPAEELEPVVTSEPEVVSTPDLPYEIVRGDTLWDISIEFYGTPWHFREIADYNRIENPDLIFADDDIVIPGKED